MRAIAYVDSYVPRSNTGAEATMHGILLALKRRGWKVAVLLAEKASFTPYEVDGVQVSPVPGTGDLLTSLGETHLIVTQLRASPQAYAVARSTGVPIVQVIHNEHPGHQAYLEMEPDLTLFNSNWVRAHHLGAVGPSLVLWPPIDLARYRTSPGNQVTLVNLSLVKGSDLFYELAARLPHVKFLGVRGHYLDQDVRELPNVTIVPNTPRMNEIYRRTKVLLVPSVTESFGRVGIEAAASGIPAIASPTPGLIESLAESGIFLRRDDVDGWETAVRELMDHSHAGRYNALSEQASRRALFVTERTEQQMRTWCHEAERLAMRGGQPRNLTAPVCRYFNSVWSPVGSRASDTPSPRYDSFTTAVFSPDARFATAIDLDGCVTVHDVAAGRRAPLPSAEVAYGMVAARTGHRALIGDLTGIIRIWELRTRVLDREIGTRASPAVAMVVAPDDNAVIVACQDGSVYKWDLTEDSLTLRFREHGPAGRSAATLAIGGLREQPYVLSGAGGESGETVDVWDLSTGAQISRLTGHRGPIVTIVPASDHQVVVTGSVDGTICVWNALTGILTHRLVGGGGPVYSVCTVPNTKQMVTGSADGNLRVWDSIEGGLRHVVSVGQEPIRSIAVSDDGQRVLASSGDRYIVCDPETGRSETSGRGSPIVACVADPTTPGAFMAMTWVAPLLIPSDGG